ncbi:MAG: murein hydrolase activator EnvC family protein [Rhodospirillales bacterium]
MPRNNLSNRFSKDRYIHICALSMACFLGVAITSGDVAYAKTEGSQTGHQLESIEKKLKQQRDQKKRLEIKEKKLSADLEKLNSEIVSTAKSIQLYELEALRLEARLKQLRQNEARSASRLKSARKQTAHVLMALGRMARNPPEALVVQPATPTQTVRSAILLRAAIPEIERRAHRLRVRLDELTAAQEAVSLRRYRLNDVMESLREQQKLLNALTAQKKKIIAKTQVDSAVLEKHVAKLAKEAKSLRELMEQLSRVTKRRPAKRQRSDQTGTRIPASKRTEKLARLSRGEPLGRSITKSRGTLIQPVVGRIVGRYGRPSSAGLRRKGLSFEARSGGQVVAPFRGKVVFADRFRGYGRLLIIDHGEGYHTLLAGFSRLDARVGQSVVAGEPVGVLEHLKNKNPVLYVEFRRKGQPINPLPWLTTQKAKVNK